MVPLNSVVLRSEVLRLVEPRTSEGPHSGELGSEELNSVVPRSEVLHSVLVLLLQLSQLQLDLPIFHQLVLSLVVELVLRSEVLNSVELPNSVVLRSEVLR